MRHLTQCYQPRIRRLARRVLPVVYAGRRVGCPCCGRSFRRFIKRGKSDLLCPACLSLKRHRALWLFVRDRLEGELAILHLAPEEGISQRLGARPRTRYVTADADPRSIAELTFDVMAIPFDDASFDVVLCSHVLEHVEDDRRAMRELLRVLKPGGCMYSHHPVFFELEETVEFPADRRGRPLRLRDHRRRYGRDFVARLAEAGFEVEIETLSFPPPTASFYGVCDGEGIFICRKR